MAVTSLRSWILVAALLLTCVSLEAWARKVGPEFRVNTTTAYDQNESSVSVLADGGFVVVWSSLGKIRGQRYAADGTRRGGEFRVNMRRVGSTAAPAVSGLDDGGFVVVWETETTDIPSHLDIHGQRYRWDGTRYGGEFRVNTTPVGRSPAVTGLRGGGFVVTWERGGIYGKRYSADGTPSDDEFHVNTTVEDYALDPCVATLGDDGFVVVWASVENGSVGDDYDGVISIRGQRYWPDGAPRGDEFLVSARGIYPSCAGLAGGGFVIAWQTSWNGLHDGDIHGRRFLADGEPAGGEFLVNTSTAGKERYPSVAGLTSGGFVIAWQTTAGDHRWDIHGRRYLADGQPAGAVEAKINTNTRSDQEHPSVDAHPYSDGFIVTWESYGQDGNGWGIYGQRFTGP
jgi:hypothetical protein